MPVAPVGGETLRQSVRVGERHLPRQPVDPDTGASSNNKEVL